jgi:hypothetical protein
MCHFSRIAGRSCYHDDNFPKLRDVRQIYRSAGNSNAAVAARARQKTLAVAALALDADLPRFLKKLPANAIHQNYASKVFLPDLNNTISKCD